MHHQKTKSHLFIHKRRLPICFPLAHLSRCFLHRDNGQVLMSRSQYSYFLLAYLLVAHVLVPFFTTFNHLMARILASIYGSRAIIQYFRHYHLLVCFTSSHRCSSPLLSALSLLLFIYMYMKI